MVEVTVQIVVRGALGGMNRRTDKYCHLVRKFIGNKCSRETR
jgi:hypothetical protein